ncbi:MULTISPECIES: hypothetical protein [Rhodomicrobium]|uniref:hypothetical protein n=1 Tax=Rhodomicrobium TaxID=1068 RepID=UPI000F74779A|nr:MULTISPECIES: hypothetical protein [Rhodomicrobium]
MDKLAIWVFAGLLAYICVMLTSINGKIDIIHASGTQIAVLSDVKNQTYTVNDGRMPVYRERANSSLSPLNAGLFLAGVIAMLVSWHMSRIYHTHIWTKTILKKTFGQYRPAYQVPARAEPLHPDQDCVGEPATPDGRIKDAWLPPSVRRLDVVARDRRAG